MENKDIDKAREYAEELSKLDDKRMYDRIDASTLREVAFRTGAQSRQPEIDELIEALEKLTIAIRRYDKLPDDWNIDAYNDAVGKATQLLKRYENEKNNKG